MSVQPKQVLACMICGDICPTFRTRPGIVTCYGESAGFQPHPPIAMSNATALYDSLARMGADQK